MLLLDVEQLILVFWLNCQNPISLHKTPLHYKNLFNEIKRFFLSLFVLIAVFA